MMEGSINNCRLLRLPNICVTAHSFPATLSLTACNYHLLLLAFAIRHASELNVFLHEMLRIIGHECSACAETKIQTNTHNTIMFVSAANTNCYVHSQQHPTSLQRETSNGNQGRRGHGRAKLVQCLNIKRITSSYTA